MSNDKPEKISWQYHLIWTPGPKLSTVGLWAVNAAGHRTRWDHWETPAEIGTPSLQRVLYQLYCASVEAQERSTHLP